MTRLAALILAIVALCPPLAARETVEASVAEAISITVYRDPDRGQWSEMNRDMPRGFAMISETRTVTLPKGESTIRFDGVAEGMVGVTAIVTGLPGGTIEKNRNAEILSPAALVNGALGNRVTITRTNPATGKTDSASAIVRTRADGGLVLQTGEGFEAVRCAGLPEKLTFDRVPDGLSAKPVFSIDTSDPVGGTYQVTLTYLAWGFDWQANYVATLGEGNGGGKGGGKGDGTFTMRLLSWLTVLNDNGQSFVDADLQVVAGTLNVTSNFRALSQAPRGEPLRLTCYPIGSTAQGSPVPYYDRDRSPGRPMPPPPAMASFADSIVVTGARLQREKMETAAPVAVVSAEEEDLGDLKLYRVPMQVTVAAKGLKQVAFLNKDEVEARFVYTFRCEGDLAFLPEDEGGLFQPAQMLLVTKNETEKGLGVALPLGSLTVFEPGGNGIQLVSEISLRDYAVNQDVELEIGRSSQVFAQCRRLGPQPDEDRPNRWRTIRTAITNANDHSIRVWVPVAIAGSTEARWRGKEQKLKDGTWIVELDLPANSRREYDWQSRYTR
uniref:DUF4139 domain-containing protein n=1 Tax=Parerythrobacter lutipelagi TaxID=1964208 RepID=UPI0010F66D1B|nr:hypothetical protein [Parerythrobacter lutipelagi]